MGQSADQAISIGWLNVQSLRNKTDAVEELVRFSDYENRSVPFFFAKRSEHFLIRPCPENYSRPLHVYYNKTPNYAVAVDRHTT